MTNTPAPKLFISYSWTTPTHERWVIELAERLRDDNVDVILDKWDLREGHDAHAFMEKMVSDDEIKKVAMIFDITYVEKANKRGGGVGTETQIITGEIYGQTDQDKFVAVIAEKDPDGKAPVPVYYKGRIYIDLTDADRFEAEYEKLLRWIYNKPLYVKPSLGKTPEFILGETVRAFGNRSSMKRAIDHLREGKNTASAILEEYLSSVSSAMEEMRIKKEASVEFDDQIVQSIDNFLVTRDDVISVMQAVSRYQPTEDNVKKIHRFFEGLLPYYSPPSNVSSYQSWDFDNFFFIVHELFLYTVAIFIEREQFEQARALIATDFYVGNRGSYGDGPMISSEMIDQNMDSLEHRNQRLILGKKSLRSQLLHDRNKTSGVRYDILAQADLVIYLNSMQHQGYWWPYTLLYLGHGRSPLPVFARSSSKKYFEKFKAVIGLPSVEVLRALITELTAVGGRMHRAGQYGFSIEWLTGINEIAKKD
ncbi:hypothetical protein FHW67_001735 [Herbaspirillum sp. Sphag1AN]|uniref:SEFIR domain-containing protein n=1 Tax=unclassified Herbaspirillum TaxID=2624150 RepID=UPI00160F075B|nr:MULTISPECIES: TIR domain-containing protein [unclassified Herbaspirillum]MBB3212455.1 hypothetical protein [Herbaspirillum sp. Sphag1AN]MBB3245446.1 hypothetical protein [Herbaspirillum sp. Sphag64]